MSFGLLREIRLEALANVLAEGYADRAFYMRQISRWYSKTFHTPLPQVESIPDYVLLQTYWEETYGEMTEERQEQERLRLLENDDARRQREVKEASEAYDDDEWAREVEAEAMAAERLRLEKARAAGLQVDVPDRPGLEVQPRPTRTFRQRDLPETSLPTPNLAPSFKVDFGELFEPGEEG